MAYAPISIFTDCGNGYGVALVREDGSDPVRAGVDLNATDGTPGPRIQVNGSWVDVDESFATAYRGMTSSRALADDARTTACRAISGTDPEPEPGSETEGEEDGPIGWGWFIVPVGAGGLSYGINRIARSDLLVASTDPGGLGTGMDLVYGGSQMLYTTSLIPMTRRSDTGWWAAMNGGSLAVGAGFFVVSFIRPPGRGTPELSTGLNLMTTGGVGLIYGDREHSLDPVRFYTGFGVQAGLGALALGLGLGGVGARPTVSETDMYAPEGMAPGSRDVSGNPYEANRFPALDRDLLWIGVSHLAGATINMIDYQIQIRSGTPSETETRPRVSVTPTPGGMFLGVRGSF